jgi:ubiquinone/menaquinone biosynthesis C-methylase UbiE
LKEILRASYDRSADRYDEQFRPLQREKYRVLLGSDGGLLRATLGRQGSQILDIGCGTGLLAEWLSEAGAPPAGLAGLDFSRRMVERARARGLAAVEGDLERLPFRDGAFAAALAFTALGILPGSPARALAEAARVLAPGGVLALSVLRAAAGGLEAELRAAGFAPGPRRECGQDYGWICSRR